MPYASDKQRRFMHAQHPDIARKWDAEMQIPENNGRTKKPGFVPSGEREIPENNGRPKPPSQFKGNPAIGKIKNKYRAAALKNKINNSKGTPHQQHLAHLAHKANVRNNPRKYG